jgi:enoyl-[acyl-carrier-protein] reductase (NADH)
MLSGYLICKTQGIETAQQHFAKQLESSGGKLSGCVHCAGIAIKQEWTNNMVDSIPNFEKMLKVNVRRLLPQVDSSRLHTD